jgi:uncharacterized membrane protein YraQ (UPF0718 family)
VSKIWKFLKLALLLAWVFLMILLGAFVAWENPQSISVRAFGYALPEQSIALYIFVSLLIGVLIGYSLSYLKTQGKQWKSSRNLKAKNKEIKKLKAMLPEDA